MSSVHLRSPQEVLTLAGCTALRSGTPHHCQLCSHINFTFSFETVLFLSQDLIFGCYTVFKQNDAYFYMV